MLSGVGTPDVQQTITTTQLAYKNGTYKANIIDTFYVDQVKFFDNTAYDTTVIRKTTNQSLNMYNAIHTTNYTTTNLATSDVITVSSDLYMPQQFPFCTMQTIRITPSQDLSTLNFFHEMYAKNNLINTEYNNNVIFNETINNAQGLYILSGKGTTADGNTVACASLYLIEFPSNNLGFNVFRTQNKAYNRFQFASLAANTTYRMHVVSAILTSYDFDAPMEECKRILLSIANSDPTAAQVAARIRSVHTSAWAQFWNSDVNITPKTGISNQEAADLYGLKRQLRYGMYSILSCVRDNINVEVNPLNLSVIDYDGSVLYNGDLWLIPLLIFIRPDVARALLEYRYTSLTTARQLAAGYGFKGAKYPYVNDSIGYKNALYWDTVGPMSLFNTGLISINVWNYYRITKNRDWLTAKGYPILKDIADFFVSIATVDEFDIYHIKNVQNLNGTVSDDQNSLTNNMAKLAIKYAIEASYELSYFVKESWLQVYYNLPLTTDPSTNVILFDTSAPTALSIVEPWIILIPYYSQVYFNPDRGRSVTDILTNIDYYASQVTSPSHPFNVASEAVLYGLYAQYNSAYVANFKEQVYGYVKSMINGPWGQLTMKPNTANDIILNSMLIFMVLQGAMQMNIQGGVAATRFYYEPMQMSSLTSANLPDTWKSITVITSDQRTFTTTNKLYYIGGQPCA